MTLEPFCSCLPCVILGGSGACPSRDRADRQGFRQAPFSYYKTKIPSGGVVEARIRRASAGTAGRGLPILTGIFEHFQSVRPEPVEGGEQGSAQASFVSRISRDLDTSVVVNADNFSVIFSQNET
jgi:hypothetical protein